MLCVSDGELVGGNDDLHDTPESKITALIAKRT